MGYEGPFPSSSGRLPLILHQSFRPLFKRSRRPWHQNLILASCCPKKRHATRGLKTSMSLGNICGLHLLNKVLNAVQCPHFRIPSKVSGLSISTKLGLEGNTKKFGKKNVLPQRDLSTLHLFTKIYCLWKHTPMSEALINHGPAISRTPEWTCFKNCRGWISDNTPAKRSSAASRPDRPHRGIGKKAQESGPTDENSLGGKMLTEKHTPWAAR